MRKILALVLLIFIISPVSGIRQEIYSKAIPSDKGIYNYFSELLKEAGDCLNKFLYENNAVNLSVSLYHKVKLTEEESRFYAAKGVKSNVSIVVKPFLSLSSGIKKLTWSQLIFLENARSLFKNKNNYSAYLNARAALINMKLAADKINRSISDIEQIELWNGSSKLRFNVSELKSELKDVYNLIAYYESTLTKFEKDGITVVVSDAHPFLHQEITIYVYAKNVKPTSLFIDGTEYELKNNTVKHSFEEIGEHTIYAEGVSNGKIVKSNVIKVYVSKIPTYIILSSKSAAFLNEKVEVTGCLSDYYGNPISANITAKIDGKELKLTTYNGLFRFNVTNDSEGFLNVSVFYSGNETYESSNATISIFFTRFPTLLYIDANRTCIGVNETVSFTGRIEDVNYSIPIHVFVNSTNVKTLNAIKEFSFNLNFSKPGTYVVFAYFPGDLLHRPAESNRIEIVVKSGSGSQKLVKMVNKIPENSYFLLIIAVVAVILTSAYVKSRRKGIESKTEHVEELRKEEFVKEGAEKAEEVVKELNLPEGVEEAYKTLFRALISRYNLKKGLTPRELLKSLKNKPFAEKLNIVTDLHERVVYGKMELKDGEREIYFRFVTEILEEIR